MPGRHPAIVDTDLFEAVQQRLKSNAVTHRDRPLRSADLPLKGLVHDADGHRMSPSFGYGRGGKVYRYYVSAPLQQGGKLDRRDGALRRVRAEALHEVVEAALVSRHGHGGDLPLAARLASVTRVDLLAEEVRITFQADRLLPAARKGLETVTGDAAALALAIPVRCQARGGRVEQVGPDGRPLAHRHRRDPVLIKGLRRAHQLASGLGWNASDGALRQVDVAAPASAYDRKLVRLAFLAPDLQRAILEGRQAPGLTLSRLLDDRSRRIGIASGGYSGQLLSRANQSLATGRLLSITMKLSSLCGIFIASQAVDIAFLALLFASERPVVRDLIPCSWPVNSLFRGVGIERHPRETL